MSLRLPPFARIPFTIALACVLGLSIGIIKNTVTSSWQNMQQQSAQFDRSPGCRPSENPSQVDSTLPPCQNVLLSVVAKPTKTPLPPFSFSDHSKQHFYLTLRNPAGQTQTDGPVSLDMWASLHIGDQVQAVYWRNQMQDFHANGFQYVNTAPLHLEKLSAIIMFWSFVAITCGFSLQELWNPRRKPASSWLWFNIAQSKNKSRW